MIKKLAILLMFTLISTQAFAIQDNIILGKEDAPVEVKVYYSITCSACSNLHKKIIPQIEKDYVIKDKVKVEYAPYPLDETSLVIEVFLACMPDRDDHQKALDTFLSSQKSWVVSNNISLEIHDILSDYMTIEEMAKCERDEESYKVLYEKLSKYKNKKIVKSTPTIFINGKPTESLQYSVIKDKIETELNK
jgi:protein-disulfide isomerase